MRFWELTSVFRGREAVLSEVLADPRWSEYATWFRNLARIVRDQDRVILDAPVPQALADAALRRLPLRFSLDGGTLRLIRDDGREHAEVLTALEVAQRYDGSTVEEVLEFGSAKVRSVGGGSGGS